MPKEIIDTHVHVWNFSKAEYEWLKGDTSILNRNYDIEQLESDRVEAGVIAGVLVQAANNFEDTDWMLEVAEKTAWITGVVGWVPLMRPEATENVLAEKYRTNNFFKGVRHLIHNEPDTEWLLQPQVIDSLSILAQQNLPYDVVGINTHHLQTAIKVSKKVPHLKMVFDHANQPPIAAQEKFGLWGKLMQEAAGHPNFYIKISGLGITSGKGENWSAEDIKPYIEFLLEHFGADRCFCGGDWPVSLLASNYVHTWNVYKIVLSQLLSEEDREKVFSKNAKEFYRL